MEIGSYMSHPLWSTIILENEVIDMNTILTIILVAFLGINMGGCAYMFFTLIRDDIRSERKKKQEQLNQQ
jgi:hypothetical protein